MKSICAVLISIFFLAFFPASVFAFHPASGFFLPDSVHEMTLKYRTVKGLIVLPVTINDSISVNLILDTGCRNLLLFGKKFRRSFQRGKGKPVQFSGLGNGRPVVGSLSIGNKVSINEVLGEQIPIVIASIGMDVLRDYVIILNYCKAYVCFKLIG